MVFTIVQRIAELFLSKSNEKYITSRGGRIIPEKNYIFMVLLHTSWLVVIAYFAFFTKLSFQTTFFIPATIFFFIGQAFRLSAIFTLGRRWSTRIMILPEAPAIRKGLFTWIKHPNYLGVCIEIAALPLIGGLILPAILFSLLNFTILFFRIRLEEKLLSEFNDYSKIFA